MVTLNHLKPASNKLLYTLNIMNVSVELLLFKLEIKQYEDAVVMPRFVKVLLLYFRHWGNLFAQMHLAQLDTFMRCFETFKS